MKPPLPYFGSKTSLARRIVAMFSPHRSYVDLFAGSLAVTLAKPRSLIEIANDLDDQLMCFWRLLRDRCPDLLAACAATPHSRTEFDLARYRGEDLDELERARRVWTSLTQGRIPTLGDTGWRHNIDPHGTNQAIPDQLLSLVRRMPAVAARLRHVTLECRDAIDVAADHARHPDTLIYADPPYIEGVRDGATYRVEMRDPARHEALADVLRDAKAAVVLSGYDSPLYADLYAGWHAVRIDTRTGQATGDQSRTEVLWINRPPAHDLFSEVSA